MIAPGSSRHAVQFLALGLLAAGLAACSSFPMMQPAPGPAAVVTAPPAPPVIGPGGVAPPVFDDKGNRTSLTALPPR